MRRRKLFDDGIGRSKIKSKFNAPDQDYGLTEPLDNLITNEELALKKLAYIKMLTDVDRKQLEMLTVEQNLSQLWVTERKKRLTASTFGDICKMRPTTSCGKKVHSLLYKPPTICKQMSYGIEMEPIARAQFEKNNALTVKLCGLFCDEEFPYLAASPGKTYNFYIY